MDKKIRFECLRETYFSLNTHRLRVKEWKQILHANDPKKAGVAIITKINFKLKMLKRDKDHYIVKKG